MVSGWLECEGGGSRHQSRHSLGVPSPVNALAILLLCESLFSAQLDKLRASGSLVDRQVSGLESQMDTQQAKTTRA